MDWAILKMESEVKMDDEASKRIMSSWRSGKKRAGRMDLFKHLRGNRITQRQAIRAKCYDCNGMGELKSCSIETCSLFHYSPYKKLR
jgi:hypothetical protein